MLKKTRNILIIMFLFCFVPLYAQAQQGKQSLTIRSAMKLDESGKHSEAVEALKNIISQNPEPKNMQAHLSLGLIHFREGEYYDALDNFSKSVAIKSDNPMAYYFMGMIYEKKALGTSNWAVAKEMKTKALQSWQNYITCVDSKKVTPDAHRNIGITIKEGIRRAKKHIEILKEGLRDEQK
jgi:tetratricopeptide (TPR) repeat protein